MHSGEDFTKSHILALEKILLHTFSDRELLKAAFTHRTFANEHGGQDNERLEFLGDAVLELIISERVFSECKEDEGELTRLRQQYVSREALEEATDLAGLMDFLRFTGTENNVGGKTRSNLFESALGALYLDGGLPAAKALCEKYLRFTRRENYRSLLQELVQEEGEMPTYTTREKGEGFVSEVEALGKTGEGTGRSKQIAEAEAARALYQILKERKGH